MFRRQLNAGRVVIATFIFSHCLSSGPSLVSSQQFNRAATAQVTLIEFEYGGAISHQIPGSEFYGPQHDKTLCIHPAVNPRDFDLNKLS